MLADDHNCFTGRLAGEFVMSSLKFLRHLNLFLISVSKITTLIQGFDARLANRPFLVFDCHG